MSQDEIIVIAQEAGIPYENIVFLASDRCETGMELLVRFANLVADAEREACAKVCEYRAMALDYSGNQYVRDHAAIDCARSIRVRRMRND